MLIYLNKTMFDGTRLYISDPFSPLEIAIDPWDKNLKVEIINAGFDPEFEPQNEDFNLLDFHYTGDDGYDSNDNPVAEFLKCIPAVVMEKVRRFKFKQLQLLQLLSVISDLDDALKDENLILLWLLIGKSTMIGMDRTTQLNILAKGYEDILGQLYDKPHLSIFDIRKIVGADFTKPGFDGLEYVIETGSGFSILTNMEKIPIRLLRLMSKYPNMSNSKLLYNIFKSKRQYLDVISEIDPLSKIWAESLSLAGVLRIENQQEKLNAISSQSALYRIRNRWFEQVENLGEFPPPPIEGTSVIVPIRSPIDLFTVLGSEHFLAAAYIDQVNQGKTYFYEAKMPAEVMIKVDIESIGNRLADVWSIDDQGINPETRLFIEKWFEEENEKSSLLHD
jgi:hypothetical protein